MALYTPTSMSTYVSAGNAATLYGEVVYHTANARNPLMMLAGGEKSNSPFIVLPDLTKRGGETVYRDFMTGIKSQADVYWPEPKKMDFDTHTYESLLNFVQETVTIMAWREAIMLSELMKKKPAYNLREASIEALTNYHALKAGTYLLKVLLHQTWTGASSSGALYDASTSTTGSAFCANQVYAGAKTGVHQLAATDIYTSDLALIAKEVAYSGERRDGDYTFRMKHPIVGGKQYDGVLIMSQLQAHDLEHNDEAFKTIMRDALERGKQNPSWQGLGTMFEYQNILHIVLTDMLEDVLKFTTGVEVAGTSTGIYDEGGTSRNPAVKGATAVFLAGNALFYVPANRDKFLEWENWDGTWFERAITGQMCGAQRIKITEPRAAAMRDYGTVLIHTACSHHNLTLGA